MVRISQQALVLYSCQQMYDLVMDVESYPEFLPHCRGAQVLQRREDSLDARLDLARGPVHQSFATRNRFVPDERIELDLLEGPFRRLSGVWRFEPVSGQGSRIQLQLEFELKGALKYIVTPIVSEVANQMLKAMVSRADQLYGNGGADAR